MLKIYINVGILDGIVSTCRTNFLKPLMSDKHCMLCILNTFGVIMLKYNINYNLLSDNFLSAQNFAKSP